jgi:hypothetical protein
MNTMYMSIGLLEYYETHKEYGYWNDMYNKMDNIATQKFFLFFLKDSFWSKSKEEKGEIPKVADSTKELGSKKTQGLFSKAKKD